MKKFRFVPAVALAAAASLVATPALAAQTPDEINQTIATQEQLSAIVTAEVSQAYSGVDATIRDLVARTVRAIITGPSVIADLAVPLVKASIKASIGEYIQDSRLNALIDAAVESVSESELLNAIVTREFTDAVLARTADYAVAEITGSVGLIQAEEAIAASAVSRVWNAPLVAVGTAPTKVKSDLGSPIYVLGIGANTSYYNYNVASWNQRKVLFANIPNTPKDIQVTGWNTAAIRLLAKSAAIAGAGSTAVRTATAFATLNYPAIFADALHRALNDEIARYNETLVGAVKTVVVASLQSSLSGIGVEVTLNGGDSWDVIAAQIGQGMLRSAGNALTSALAALPWVPSLGSVPSIVLDVLAPLAQAAGSFMASSLGNVNWLSLFR
ncbi:MAG: hypothetical protein LBK28_04165 [Propionibacteriaceae bacterium]|jgi:hypothetical protein|nr:hypothetical protein [Propionibacteriaceae bacterium]